MWEVGVGDALSAGKRGIWHRLLSPRLPDKAPPLRLLPYIQAGSPGYRLARRLGRVRRWWRETLWPEAGREFTTLVAALGLALLVGAILRRDVLVLVLVSVFFSWLAVLSDRRDTSRDSARRTRGRKGVVTLWHALGQFGVPWLIGATVLGGPTVETALLGVCYTITYFGLIHYARGFWLIGASQAAAALLLAGLRHPMAAGAIAILLMPQWGLHGWAAYADQVRGDQPPVSGSYLRYVQPFVLVGMLIAALVLAS
jgi:hypothetical protein